MAKLYVTECRRLPLTVRGLAQIEDVAGSFDQTPVAIGGSSAQSAAFGLDTVYVCLHADAICSVAYGSNPTATANNRRLPADTTIYLGVNPGDKIAVISNT